MDLTDRTKRLLRVIAGNTFAEMVLWHRYTGVEPSDDYWENLNKVLVTEIEEVLA